VFMDVAPPCDQLVFDLRGAQVLVQDRTQSTARADGTQAVTRSTSGNAKEQKKARHVLLPACGDVAAASPECDSFEVCCHQCGLSEGCLAPIQCNVKDIVGWR
jgi:hypothetical protein